MIADPTTRWKCAVLIDAVFYGSAKHADRKSAGKCERGGGAVHRQLRSPRLCTAVSLASSKALEELENAQK